MENSHFSNPSGLDAENHCSSAYDMALLARACLENETLADMVSTRSITFGTRTFTNHNKLLWRYEGCVGMKTGYTEAAGRTLVSAAERDGMTLICVTLGDPNDWADHAALFDYGFASYRWEEAARAGETLCRLPVQNSLLPFCPVTAEEDVGLCLAPEEEAVFQLELNQTALTAPVAAGAAVGEGVWLVNGREAARVTLVTAWSVDSHLAPRQGLLDRLLERLGELSE